ncbi:reverse transcriptase zinc-binding domain-containing protein [Tanacetum coccineum]
MKRVNTFIAIGSEVQESKEKKVEGSKETAKGSRKKMLGRKRAGKEQQQQSSKKQKVEKEKESEEVEEVDEIDEAELKKRYDDTLSVDKSRWKFQEIFFNDKDATRNRQRRLGSTLEDSKGKVHNGNYAKAAWKALRSRVMRNSLRTQDKLRQWDVGDGTDLNLLQCALCESQKDSHPHLFFECAFSSKVWQLVFHLADLDQVPPPTSYFIWMERNNRLFKKVKKKPEEIRDMVMIIVSLMLLTLRFKNKLKVAELLSRLKMPSNFRLYGSFAFCVLVAKLCPKTKIVDMVVDSAWNWPIDWDDSFDEVKNVHVLCLDPDVDDKAVWVDKKGKVKDFFVREVWKAVRIDCPKVIWKETYRDEDCLFKIIVESVTMKLIGLNIKSTSSVLEAANVWNLQFNRNAYYRRMDDELHGMEYESMQIPVVSHFGGALCILWFGKVQVLELVYGDGSVELIGLRLH